MVAKAKNIKKKVRDFCSDKDGQLVLAQKPNLPIIGWLVFKLASIPVSDQATKTGLETIATFFIFTWAYLEVVEGDSNFRRLLGVILITLLVTNIFL
jgi:uncharacterized membrane protein